MYSGRVIEIIQKNGFTSEAGASRDEDVAVLPVVIGVASSRRKPFVVSFSLSLSLSPSPFFSFILVTHIR